MSSFNLLSLGTQAVRANQTALGVVGQNISNVNTEGYTRQVVHFNSVVPSGVKLEDVERVTNGYLTQQFWTDSSNYHASDIYTDMAFEVDGLLGKDITSVTTAMDLYFGTMQNAVDDPTSMAHRELLLQQSSTLEGRFNSLYDNINDQHSKINYRLDTAVDQVNAYAKSVSELNDQIRIVTLSGDSANELIDQRDRAVEEIAKRIDIQTIDSDDNMIDIRIAHGQPLVVGLSANELYTYRNSLDPVGRDIAIDIAGTKSVVSDQISGGTLGGLLSYRREVLNPTLNELGRVAIAFSESMNTVQKAGMDLRNDLGDDLFQDVNSSRLMYSRIQGDEKNRGTYPIAQVEISDLSKLTSDEYELDFVSYDEFRLKNLTTGEVHTQDSLQRVQNPVNPHVTEGSYFMDDDNLVLEIGGSRLTMTTTSRFVPGDTFRIQPTRMGAEQISVEMTDPQKLALANPVRINTGIDNMGTGEASVVVTDVNDKSFTTTAHALTPPVEIVFNGADPLTYTAFDMTDPASPQPLDIGHGPMEDLTFVAGKAIELGGYAVTIVNDPHAGDTFSFEYNLDGFSDNRNALAMSNLQKADVLDTGSYQDVYSGILERVAGTTSRSKIVTESQKSVLDATIEVRSSISGVNMDEEAAKLVQFQQAYQASAQIISVSQKLFDTILNI